MERWSPVEPADDVGDRPADRHDAFPGPGEPRRLDPRVRTKWWVRGALQAGAAALAAGAVDHLVLPGATNGAWSPGPLSWTVAAVGVLLAAGTSPLRYRRWRYALRTRDLWIRRGILHVVVSVIPYERLQFVDTEQGPLDRILGIAELVVHTAAPGTSGRVPGLDAEEAEAIRERLARVGPDHAGSG